MPADVASLGAALPAFSGVYVFGDSLVDPGNDLKAAQLLNGLPFAFLPKGAPTADKGDFEGRFTHRPHLPPPNQKQPAPRPDRGPLPLRFGGVGGRPADPVRE